jgi:hypothetical protein
MTGLPNKAPLAPVTRNKGISRERIKRFR